MAKKQNKKQNKVIKKVNRSILEIENSRTGGQVALIGYEYQVLYSSYLLLSFLISEDRKVRLEGIEDIDTYIASNDEKIEHVQLKYSKDKQDASFLKGILKNYLEVYLLNKTNDSRYFTLIYDFDVANGGLSQIINGKMDKKAKDYWTSIIGDIKKENTFWDWNSFDINHFFGHLKFKNIKKIELVKDIERILIEKYEISTGNESLYVNGLFYFCFEKMREREYIDYPELIKRIQQIKDNIDKGAQNPAHKWIEKIDFDNLAKRNDEFDYYEGKKAEPVDIVNQLPVRREILERKIEESINEHVITVVKSSSGQGKTTLAWQAAYNLRDMFTIYKLNWCNETKELDNIVEYFKSRIKIGEKILIVLDNLDIQLKEWNTLAQFLSRKISINYKLLVTTREDDWYSFSGDPTNLKDMKVIDISLDITQAEKVYLKLKMMNKIHNNITNWQSSWEAVAEKGLLIEYIYLLTHGEMINDRITQQIKNMHQNKGSAIKISILRQITLADVMGIKLPVKGLMEQFSSVISEDLDLNELLKSIENEFYIKITDRKVYVEGLHPVRSQHIVNRLHEYTSISDTVLKMLKIIDEVYISKLYSNLAFYIKEDKDKFYRGLIDSTFDNNYTYFLNALRGLYSGSVLDYYNNNRPLFDDANEHGGLMLLLSEVNPFNRFEEVNTEVRTLNELQKIMPEDSNIKHLSELSDKIDKFKIQETDFYIYSYYLFNKLKQHQLNRDLNNYANLASWLIKVDKEFDIVTKLSMLDVWNNKEKWGIEAIAQLMYNWWILKKTDYLHFIENNKQEILEYLKIVTSSLRIYENPDHKEIHVEYVLLPDKIKSANQESVKRLNIICKVLPIYETYCADKIKPSVEMLNFLNIPDDAHKEMPIRNIIISFNSEFANLWADTIMSNYECASIYDLLYFWYELRGKIVKLFKHNVYILEKTLNKQKINNELLEYIDELRDNIFVSLRMEKLYPHQKRPFEKPQELPDISKVKGAYFSSIRNYTNQMVSLLMKKNDNNTRLAFLNLRDAENKLFEMQSFFNNIANESNNFIDDFERLCKEEVFWINRLIILNDYYLNVRNNFFYNKNSVNLWKIQKDRQYLSSIISKIDETNQFGFDFVFPSKIIEEGYIKKVPIIIKNFDIEDENKLSTLILVFVPVIDLEVDYIYILFCNGSTTVTKNGLSISKLSLEKVKAYFTTESESELKDISPPLPIEITNDILSCFNDEFQLEKEKDYSNLENIDNTYLQLWEYSQYAKYLTSDNIEEKKYLSRLQKNKKDQIETMLEKIRNVAPTYFVNKIDNLKKAVIEDNYLFDDVELNTCLNEILKYAKASII